MRRMASMAESLTENPVMYSMPGMTDEEFASFEAFLGHLVKSDREVGRPETPQPDPIELREYWQDKEGRLGYVVSVNSEEIALLISPYGDSVVLSAHQLRDEWQPVKFIPKG